MPRQRPPVRARRDCSRAHVVHAPHEREADDVGVPRDDGQVGQVAARQRREVHVRVGEVDALLGAQPLSARAGRAVIRTSRWSSWTDSMTPPIFPSSNQMASPRFALAMAIGSEHPILAGSSTRPSGADTRLAARRRALRVTIERVAAPEQQRLLLARNPAHRRLADAGARASCASVRPAVEHGPVRHVGRRARLGQRVRVRAGDDDDRAACAAGVAKADPVALRQAVDERARQR